MNKRKVKESRVRREIYKMMNTRGSTQMKYANERDQRIETKAPAYTEINRDEHAGRQTCRQKDKQTHRQTDTQTHRHTHRHTDRHTHRHIHTLTDPPRHTQT